MRRLIAALALCLTPVMGFAQSAPDLGRFQKLTATIASDPAMAGQWIDLLPEIALRCGFMVDHERTALLVNGYDHPERIDEAADYFASGPVSDLKAAWDAIAARDQNQACRLGSSLWGETGTLSAGVLHGRKAPPVAVVMQPAGKVAAH